MASMSLCSANSAGFKGEVQSIKPPSGKWSDQLLLVYICLGFLSRGWGNEFAAEEVKRVSKTKGRPGKRAAEYNYLLKSMQRKFNSGNPLHWGKGEKEMLFVLLNECCGKIQHQLEPVGTKNSRTH
jgi:hypothetical protein